MNCRFGTREEYRTMARWDLDDKTDWRRYGRICLDIEERD